MAMQAYNEADPINLGTGSEVSIRDLVALICQLMDFQGEVIWQTDQPNGQPRRCLDTAKAKDKFGFTANFNLTQGLQNTINWYRQHPQ
jgi:GDP-L-fucose synthase